MTHNPEAFEMERRQFERVEDLGSGAGCLYLDGIFGLKCDGSFLYLLLRVGGLKKKSQALKNGRLFAAKGIHRYSVNVFLV